MPERPEPDNALRQVLSKGAELGGTTSGAIIGALVGGPPGAAVGAGAGWLIEALGKAGAEVAQRWLSPRSEIRVGAVLLLAAEEVSARLMAGEIPRDDLRDEGRRGPSPASELVEATLISASQTHEERKIPYLAHLLAAIPFEPDLTPAEANQLIGLAHSLSYRQLVALAKYAEEGWTRSTEKYKLYGEGYPFADEAPTLRSIRTDMLDLFHRGLLEAPRRTKTTNEEGIRTTEDLGWPGTPLEMSPRDLCPSPSGTRLVRMMRLDQIPDEDRETLVIQHVRLPPR
jgi:hypothetical protein